MEEDCGVAVQLRGGPASSSTRLLRIYQCVYSTHENTACTIGLHAQRADSILACACANKVRARVNIDAPRYFTLSVEGDARRLFCRRRVPIELPDGFTAASLQQRQRCSRRLARGKVCPRTTCFAPRSHVFKCTWLDSVSNHSGARGQHHGCSWSNNIALFPRARIAAQGAQRATAKVSLMPKWWSSYLQTCRSSARAAIMLPNIPCAFFER
jgi:hypothetical protein